uniref:Uncharacterized protein n=1 Tax=Arundo donax TaxID=35708 RepID=A0A0A9C484_ARUDO
MHRLIMHFILSYSIERCQGTVFFDST